MELWIRIQNRYRLLKVEDIIVSGDDICCDNEKGRLILGTYKNEERALEVLDEMQNILQPKYILDSSSIKPDGDSWAENGMILQKYNANARVEELSTYVYKMPKE